MSEHELGALADLHYSNKKVKKLFRTFFSRKQKFKTLKNSFPSNPLQGLGDAIPCKRHSGASTEQPVPDLKVQNNQTQTKLCKKHKYKQNYLTSFKPSRMQCSTPPSPPSPSLLYPSYRAPPPGTSIFHVYLKFLVFVCRFPLSMFYLQCVTFKSSRLHSNVHLLAVSPIGRLLTHAHVPGRTSIGSRE